MNKNITATILIILGIGIYFTVTEGIIEEAKVVRAKNQEYAKALENAERLIEVRDKLLADYNNLSVENRDRLNKMLPRGVDNIRLVIDLNGVAQKHGFTLKGIKTSTTPPPAAKTPPSIPAQPAVSGGSGVSVSGSSAVAAPVIPTPVLDTVTVSFGVNATYQEFRSFLQDLEANLRLMDLTHLSLAVTDLGVYDWNVELKTYWLRSQ